MSILRNLLFGVVSLLALDPCVRGQDNPQRAGTAREGEICAVCNDRVSGKDACYLAGGQRLVVHASDACEGELLRHPIQYLVLLRPSDILFSVWSHSGLALSWFWAGIMVLLGLVFGGLCAHRAIATGRAPLTWFLAGLVFSVAAYGYLLVAKPAAEVTLPPGLRKVAPTRDPVPCPACGAGNHPSARHCSSCGGELNPMAPSEVSLARNA